MAVANMISCMGVDASCAVFNKQNNMIGHVSWHWPGKSVVAVARSDSLVVSRPRKRRTSGKERRWFREPIGNEKLDIWMKESIGEIVRSVGEGPLVVRIFSDDDQSPCLRLETDQMALSENWEEMKKKWDEERQTPDAIVLVDELKCETEDNNKRNCARRTWGLAVQGRGTDCASCYILSTSSLGLCRHFCLMRAQCFGEPWEVQLRNAWLQGR